MPDETFTFNTDGFENGLKRVSKGMGQLVKNASNMAKNVSKGVVSAIAKIGLLSLAFKGIQKAISEMPEIGKAFGIAKDIISKNLLFPLRKAVFPLLQRFLDWVRDNRAMFVRWGQNLVNVFESVSGAVGQIINLGKELVSGFSGFFDRIFGSSVKNINELFNILSFKFSVAVTFITSIANEVLKNLAPLLDPLLDLFGNIFNFVTEAAGSIIGALMPALKEIIPVLTDIFKSINDIVELLFSSEDSLNTWKDVFSFLSKGIGENLLKAFKDIESIINNIKEAITFIESSIKSIISGKAFEIKAPDIGKFFRDFAKFSTGGFLTEKVQDVIITKKGEVIQTSPEDTIMAFKGLGGERAPAPVNISVDFRGMQLNIQSATREEAERFSEDIVTTFRRQLTLELERTGVK